MISSMTGRILFGCIRLLFRDRAQDTLVQGNKMSRHPHPVPTGRFMDKSDNLNPKP